MSIRFATFGTCAVALVLCAPVAVADPADPPVIEPAAADAPPPDEVPPPPVDDGRVPSAPPQTVKTPDGWTLTVSSKDEVQMPIAPLTTAVSSREYSAGGVFNGSLVPPDSASAPRGVLEVGYQIGCGIDMSTSNGVTLTGSVGLNSGVGLSGPLGALPTSSRMGSPEKGSRAAWPRPRGMRMNASALPVRSSNPTNSLRRATCSFNGCLSSNEGMFSCRVPSATRASSTHDASTRRVSSTGRAR